jgi:DNA-binding MarR family transcriptional regulator
MPRRESTSTRLPPVLDAISWIQHGVLRRLSAVLAGAGFPEVGVPQLALLTSIPPGGIRMSALADKVRITRGAVTQLVAGLESAGLLTRTPDPVDGRGIVVTPTSRALRGYSIAFQWTAERYGAWERRVGRARWRVFRAVLEEIAELEGVTAPESR